MQYYRRQPIICMYFGKLVKFENGEYKVAGALRVQKNEKFDSTIKVTQASDTLVQCKYHSYVELPKVILTYMNFSRNLSHELKIFVKWVYHQNIDVRIGLFGIDAHIQKNQELRQFMEEARFVYRTNDVNHINVFKLMANLEVVYFSLNLYDRGFLYDEDDDHVLNHHDIKSFKVVIYLKPTNANETNASETIKIIPIRFE